MSVYLCGRAAITQVPQAGGLQQDSYFLTALEPGVPDQEPEGGRPLRSGCRGPLLLCVLTASPTPCMRVLTPPLVGTLVRFNRDFPQRLPATLIPSLKTLTPLSCEQHDLELHGRTHACGFLNIGQGYKCIFSSLEFS